MAEREEPLSVGLPKVSTALADLHAGDPQIVALVRRLLASTGTRGGGYVSAFSNYLTSTRGES